MLTKEQQTAALTEAEKVLEITQTVIGWINQNEMPTDGWLVAQSMLQRRVTRLRKVLKGGSLVRGQRKHSHIDKP